MKRFTLKPGKWYACEIIGDEFNDCDDLCSYSPIKIYGIKPEHSGKRIFRLDFHHANYPAGVQQKEYKLQTLERGQYMMLAKSVEHKYTRILQIYDITPEWIITHFPGQKPDRKNIQGWLDKNA